MVSTGGLNDSMLNEKMLNDWTGVLITTLSAIDITHESATLRGEIYIPE